MLDMAFLETSTFAREYIIREYCELLTELRYVNDKTLSYTKILSTIVSSFILYTLAGSTLVLTKAKIDLVCLLFSLFGLFLCMCIFYTVYIGLRQFSVSKKHRARYWRAIHAIRNILISSSKGLREHIVLPVDTTATQTGAPRPNISPGEFFTGFFITLSNYIFFLLFFVYFWVLFELSLKTLFGKANIALCNLGQSPLVQANIIAAIITSLMIWSIVSVLYPHNSLWYYYKNLQTARVITAQNPYFSLEIDCSNRAIMKFITFVATLFVCVLIGLRVFIFCSAFPANSISMIVAAISLAIIVTSQIAGFFVRRHQLIAKYSREYPFIKADIISDVNVPFKIHPKSKRSSKSRRA